MSDYSSLHVALFIGSGQSIMCAIDALQPCLTCHTPQHSSSNNPPRTTIIPMKLHFHSYNLSINGTETFAFRVFNN